MPRAWLALVVVGGLSTTAGAESGGWQALSPRDEIRPEFAQQSTGGPDGKGCLVIRADGREGLHGTWARTYPIVGGRYYAFHVLRKVDGIPFPRRHVLVTITWQDAKGKNVRRDEPTTATFNPGKPPMAAPEYPPDGLTDAQGWTEIAGVYAAPQAATQAFVELHLRWAPAGKVEWSTVTLAECPASKPRKVRIAVVHFRPQGGSSNAEQCRLYEPLLKQAAGQRADLVVLGETLTYAFRKPRVEMVDAAEPIPGPSTEYFVQQAKKHHFYVVAGLVERDRHLVYNTAVLVGPEGFVGKYRKVTLPRGEWTGGVFPGHEFPVFPTPLGKIGIMVCYDGFYPEVARQLSAHGAEIIAFPVWGCNPDLVRARAVENQVYVASSTYTDAKNAWMQTAVYDHSGRAVAEARQWGTIAVAEVDLSRPTYWESLGNYREEHQRHRPRWNVTD
jgi:predicted amidohydrolase